jgi:hypothetical protein
MFSPMQVSGSARALARIQSAPSPIGSRLEGLTNQCFACGAENVHFRLFNLRLSMLGRHSCRAKAASIRS